MVGQIEYAVRINATPEVVWETLTDPERMKLWMGEPEMNISVQTDWREGSPFLIRGFHHIAFQNNGTVLRFEPHTQLQYTHLSSLSRLPEQDDNYTVITFLLHPVSHQTELTVRATHFPTMSVYKHLELYWRITLGIIKEVVEHG